MPTITTSLEDLRRLTGIAELSLETLPGHLELVKGEVKRGSTEAELRIELQDTNRPDTWCVEGVARQVRQRVKGPRPWREDYGFLADPGEPVGTIEVEPTVKDVRPFVQAFTAEGYKVDEAGLLAFIEAQETLSRNFGQRRRTVAIGIYDASKIEWPVRYRAVPLDDKEHAFAPLLPPGEPDGPRWREPWTPAEILRDHPAGRDFAPALEGAKAAPILVDARGRVLSFPPIVNSREIGRVEPGMDRLFVEVTGKKLDHVLLAANVLAANLRDRGATIRPVLTHYPKPTTYGLEVGAPHALPEKRSLRVELLAFARLLGEKLQMDDVAAMLALYGLEVSIEGRDLRVEAPPYRMDYLHEVDVIEDFAMARGYGTFRALMPTEFTVGRLDPQTELEDVVRDRMIGFAFEEAICNILTADELVRGRMHGAAPLERSFPEEGPRLHGGPLVRIKNVMNASYAVLRDWVLPSLLEVESHSAGAQYPHRVFEAGEVAVFDPGEPAGSRTERRLAALVAHDGANFSEAQAYLHALLKYVTIEAELDGRAPDGGRATYRLEPAAHPSFLPGRVALVRGRRGETQVVLGLLGEVHPAVLEAWGVRVPAAGFELSLAALRTLRA